GALVLTPRREAPHDREHVARAAARAARPLPQRNQLRDRALELVDQLAGSVVAPGAVRRDQTLVEPEDRLVLGLVGAELRPRGIAVPPVVVEDRPGVVELVGEADQQR